MTPADSGPNGKAFPRETRPSAAGKPAKAGKLVRRGEFDAVYRAGKRRSSSHFTVFFRANELPRSRFGFSIKKTLGGAVVRNRIRRRLREIVRCHRQEIPVGWDIVIHPKSSVAKVPFAALMADLLRLLKNV
ncbi:MAG TPA: ribonuclease P protein component [Candidatus Acidoferrum sp.]|nr:ribonuclease P protein component [Candidatus Acidoferrum sp.]